MKRLLMLVIYLIIGVTIVAICRDGMCACREEKWPIPILGVIIYRECTFPNIAEFRKAQGQGPKRYGGWGLNIDLDKIPDSAKDIYYFYAGGRDSTIYFSLILSSEEEAVKIAEGFAGVSISEFKNEIIESRSVWISDDTVKIEQVIPSFILEGPEHYGEKWKTPYWNLKEVKNGKFFNRGINYIFIDLDTYRVYLCRAEM